MGLEVDLGVLALREATQKLLVEHDERRRVAGQRRLDVLVKRLQALPFGVGLDLDAHLRHLAEVLRRVAEHLVLDEALLQRLDRVVVLAGVVGAVLLVVRQKHARLISMSVAAISRNSPACCRSSNFMSRRYARYSRVSTKTSMAKMSISCTRMRCSNRSRGPSN